MLGAGLCRALNCPTQAKTTLEWATRPTSNSGIMPSKAAGSRTMPILSKNSADQVLSPDEVRQVIAQAAAGLNIAGKRVLILIPDGTRTMPMPLMFQLL